MQPFAHPLRDARTSPGAPKPPASTGLAPQGSVGGEAATKEKLPTRKTVRFVRDGEFQRVGLNESPLALANISNPLQQDQQRQFSSFLYSPIEPISAPPRRPCLGFEQLKQKALREAVFYAVILDESLDASSIYERLESGGISSSAESPPQNRAMPWSEFESRMFARKFEIEKQWECEDRGKALSSAAHLAHLLSVGWSDSGVASYAAVWIIIVEILQDFGAKVMAYLASPQANSESSRNWQTRVLGLPGLVQRLYLTTCLGLYPESVIQQCAGIADPVAQSHLLAFVALQSKSSGLVLKAAQAVPGNSQATRFANLVIVSRACEISEEAWFDQGGPQVRFPLFFDLSLLVCSSDAVQHWAEKAITILREHSVPPKEALFELLALRLCECGPTPPNLLSALHAGLGESGHLAALAALVELASLCQPDHRAVLTLVREYDRRLRFEGQQGDFTRRVVECVVARSRGKWDKINTSDAFLRLFECMDKSPVKLRLGLALVTSAHDSSADFAAALAVAKALHDCLTTSSFDEEKREVRKAIVGLISGIGLRSETSISTLADVRSNFYRVPQIHSLVVQESWHLVYSDKGAAPAWSEHVATVMAFCLATLPSVPSTYTRGALFARTALLAASLHRHGMVRLLSQACMQCLRESPCEALLSILANVLIQTGDLALAKEVARMPWEEARTKSICQTLLARLR